MTDSPTATELHVHLEGTVSWATAADLARRHGVAVPPDYTYQDLAGFFAIYLAVNRCLVDALDFERIVLEHAQRMRLQGVACAELSFNPQLHPAGDWLDGIVSGRRRARELYGIEIGWLVELSREASLESNRRALDIALSCEGVVGLGLVGDESVPAAPLRQLFAQAHERGLGAMPHAGQTGGPAAVREALGELGATRIAHGITAAEDPVLLRALADRGVTLCVAPSSNRKAGLTADFAALAAAGVALTANTDDPAIVETTLDRELQILSDATSRPPAELQAAAGAARFA